MLKVREGHLDHFTPCHYLTDLKEAHLAHSTPHHYRLEAREAHLAHYLYLMHCYLIGIILIQVIGIANIKFPSLYQNKIQ